MSSWCLCQREVLNYRTGGGLGDGTRRRIYLVGRGTGVMLFYSRVKFSSLSMIMVHLENTLSEKK